MEQALWLPLSPLPLPAHSRQPAQTTMHALPGDSQLSRCAGLAHIADQLFDFLVMLYGTFPAGGEAESWERFDFCL